MHYYAPNLIVSSPRNNDVNKKNVTRKCQGVPDSNVEELHKDSSITRTNTKNKVLIKGISKSEEFTSSVTRRGSVSTQLSSRSERTPITAKKVLESKITVHRKPSTSSVIDVGELSIPSYRRSEAQEAMTNTRLSLRNNEAAMGNPVKDRDRLLMRPHEDPGPYSKKSISFADPWSKKCHVISYESMKTKSTDMTMMSSKLPDLLRRRFSEPMVKPAKSKVVEKQERPGSATIRRPAPHRAHRRQSEPTLKVSHLTMVFLNHVGPFF